jgi:hypothetical protein
MSEEEALDELKAVYKKLIPTGSDSDVYDDYSTRLSRKREN